MTKPAIKPGDIVQLKTGGVKMVVESITDKGYAICVYNWAQGAPDTKHGKGYDSPQHVTVGLATLKVLESAGE